MSKYTYGVLLTASLFTFTGAIADEVTRSSTTRVDNPDYSATSSTTTSEQRPSSYTTESTTSASKPYGQEVITRKSYKKSAPCAQKTVRTDTETTINR